MEITSNEKPLLVEGLDPRKIVKLLDEFVMATDATARAKTLNKIRVLSVEEKKFFDDLVKQNSEFIKPGTVLNSVDDLVKLGSAVEYAKFAQRLTAQSKNIADVLTSQGIDFSKYLAISKVLEPTTDQYYKIANDTLRKEPTIEKLLTSLKSKKYDDVNWDDLQFTIDKLRNAVKWSTLEPEINKAFKSLFDEFFRFSEDVSAINRIKNYNTGIFKPDLSPKQVAGVKISSEEYKDLKKIVDEKGLGKNWGWDNITDSPISETIKINGYDLQFSVTDTGPRVAEWRNIQKDDLWNTYQNEYKTSQYKTFPQFLYSKFKNEPDKLDLYLPKYKVLGGVKLNASSTFDGKTWLIVNSTTTPQNFDYVLVHEMTHVGQKSMESLYRRNKYVAPNKFKTAEEALDFLYRKSDFKRVEKSKNPILRYDDFRTREDAADLIDEFSETIDGRDPMDTYSDYEKFMNWAYDNGKLPKNLFDFPDVEVVYKTSKNFGSDVKKRALNLVIDTNLNSGKLSQEQIEKLTRIKNQIQNMDETQLLNYLKNNAADPDLNKIIKRTSDELGYYLSSGEIEADFTGALQEILKLGTNEDKAGFATWLVDWLRNSNKMQTLETKPEIPTKESFIEKVKNFFTKNTNKPVEPNNPFYDDMSWYFLDFLKEIETKYKKIYPDDAQKIYKGLYKQAYELISKGYPALLPFIAVGAKELMDEEPTQTTTNESTHKRLKLIDIYKTIL